MHALKNTIALKNPFQCKASQSHMKQIFNALLRSQEEKSRTRYQCCPLPRKAVGRKVRVLTVS